jgi:hypothetical protein
MTLPCWSTRFLCRFVEDRRKGEPRTHDCGFGGCHFWGGRVGPWCFGGLLVEDEFVQGAPAGVAGGARQLDEWARYLEQVK